MELITILSTIILIATICTFILSVGAYILFRIRSKRERTVVQPKNEPLQAELVTVREDEYELHNRTVNKSPRQRVQMADLEHDPHGVGIKKDSVIEKTPHEKPLASKYIKYSTPKYDQSQNNPATGDL